jgi:hypothetical protein
MPDEIFEYKLKVTAEGGGGAATAADIEKANAAARGATAESVKGGQAAAGAAQETKKAGVATEEHTKHLHEMHRAFHALNEIVPGLGVILQTVFSPLGAAISLGVIALRGFQEYLAKVNEELDKMAELNAKPLTNRLEIMRESVIRNAGSMVELGLRLQNASRSEYDLAKAIDEVISRMHQEAAEVLSLAEIRSRGELAILENLHKAALVSEQDYARRRLENEEGLSQKKRKLAEDDLQYEINIRKAGAEAAEKAKPDFAGQAESARKEAERTQTEALTAKSGMETAKENAKTAADALKKWEESHRQSVVGAFQSVGVEGETSAAVAAATAPGQPADLVALGKLASEKKLLGEQFDEWQKLKVAADLGKEAMLKAPGDVAKNEIAAAGAQNEYKLAGEDAASNARLARTAKEEVARKESELDARKKSDKDLSKAEHDANQLSRPRGMLATQDLEAAIKTALHFVDTPEMYRARHPGVTPDDAKKAVAGEKSEPVTGKDQQQMVDLATRITGQKTDRNQALAIFGKAAQDTASFGDDVGKLVTVMENLTKNLGPIRGRIDELESQVRALEGRMTQPY